MATLELHMISCPGMVSQLAQEWDVGPQMLGYVKLFEWLSAELTFFGTNEWQSRYRAGGDRVMYPVHKV